MKAVRSLQQNWFEVRIVLRHALQKQNGVYTRKAKSFATVPAVPRPEPNMHIFPLPTYSQTRGIETPLPRILGLSNHIWCTSKHHTLWNRESGPKTGSQSSKNISALIENNTLYDTCIGYQLETKPCVINCSTILKKRKKKMNKHKYKKRRKRDKFKRRNLENIKERKRKVKENAEERAKQSIGQGI